MKKKITIIASAVVVTGIVTGVLLATLIKPKDEILDQNFTINAETQYVNYGDSVYLQPFSAKDKNGEWKDAVISVCNSEGKEYEIKNFSFVPDSLG